MCRYIAQPYGRADRPQAAVRSPCTLDVKLRLGDQLNKPIPFLAGCVVALLSACSSDQINHVKQPGPTNQPGFASRQDSPGSSDKSKDDKSFYLAYGVKLAEKAVELSRRQLKLDKIILDYKSRGEAIPTDVLEAKDSIAVRQSEISEQLFSMTGQLHIHALKPGVFGSYVSECVNRINQVFRNENAETKRRFIGKTALISVQLAANGEIESVVPYTRREDEDFGSYLHGVVWKVPRFPEIPQLKDRPIERVDISIPFDYRN